MATAVALSRARSREATSVLGRLAVGLRVVNRPAVILLAGIGSLAAWVTDAVEVRLVLYAVGLHLPTGAPLLVLLALNVAIAVPATPAQLGAFELGAVVALR